MKKIVFILLLIAGLTAKAQDYEQAVGLRGGLYNGITYKKFITADKAIEGILHTRWQGWELVGLLEYHQPIVDVPDLYWFYGYGAHIGFFDAEYSPYGTGAYTVLGVDGIIGLEYNIPRAPITIGLDWKPFINLVGYTHVFGDGGALSIRYTF